MVVEVKSVPVSLRGGGFPRFLPEHELRVHDGTFQPILLDGARYEFSHLAEPGGYSGDDGEQPVHVFVRRGAASTV